MTRSLKPCGTTAAYRRHLRAGETPCDECRAANAATKRQRVADAGEKAAEVVQLAIVEAPEVERLDELERLRWNLRVAEAAIEAGVPSGLAALLKHHAELVRQIAKIEGAAKPGVSKLDELAARRAARRAGS